jgi:hypothetical protein
LGGNPEFWGKHSPVLFPIVGTLKNNTFHHNEKKLLDLGMDLLKWNFN